ARAFLLPAAQVTPALAMLTDAGLGLTRRESDYVSTVRTSAKRQWLRSTVGTVVVATFVVILLLPRVWSRITGGRPSEEIDATQAAIEAVRPAAAQFAPDLLRRADSLFTLATREVSRQDTRYLPRYDAARNYLAGASRYASASHSAADSTRNAQAADDS